MHFVYSCVNARGAGGEGQYRRFTLKGQMKKQIVTKSLQT